MEITYDQLSTAELQGTTQADYLIALDARLRVTEEREVLFEEPGFPVVELARSVLAWLQGTPRSDFEFDSMSYEEVGTLRVTEGPDGWQIDSVLGGTPTRPMTWPEVDRCLRNFVGEVMQDLRALGVDPRLVVMQ